MNENEAITHVVDTTSRLPQWRIDNFDSTSRLHSESFKIGDWDWSLILEKKRLNFVIKLVPTFVLSGHDMLISSFNARVVSLVGGRKTLARIRVRNKHVNYPSPDHFVWTLNFPLTRRFIVEVEFLDLKTASPNGGENRSIWIKGFIGNQNAKAVAAFGRLLSESIHTNIVIHASDGSIGAHRAVLAARSPVFNNMFVGKGLI
ncbi:SKP1/BTB/POZ domain-containing protein [Artemisia annua]|uniref:SKP1/BTB/POZ domain-containing protein n=1 Tax=Artemisia annua TaxID=35608 RepID=A0A2U1LTM7_ARTAN|nr:SKP1/BTB/POZ domain-containing protein [Artemisia annua]